MKKKNDDLLRLAFGELSAEEARAVEAHAAADPSARRELQACQDLRASLQHLPPPPPDNLSAERLRAAILDRELGARKPGFSWSWSWAPYALAAIAAVLFINRPAHRSEPVQLALNENVGSSLAKAAPLTPPASDFELRKAPAASTVVPVSNPETVAARHNVARRPQESRRSSVTWAPGPLFKAQDEDETGLAKFAFYQPEDIAPPSSVVTADVPAGKPEKDNNSDTVVIVSGKRDLDTGAAAASETEANRVLVGG